MFFACLLHLADIKFNINHFFQGGLACIEVTVVIKFQSSAEAIRKLIEKGGKSILRAGTQVIKTARHKT